jgi:putative hydrolase of the HAD superfamily
VTGAWSGLLGVRALLFDLGGTVVSLDHPRIERYLAEAGAPPVDGWVSRAERAGRLAHDGLVRAGAPPAEHWRGFFSAYLTAAGAAPAMVDPVFRRLVEFHRRHHLWNRPVPGVPEALAALARAGYRLAAISNSDGRAEWVLGTIGLAREFEFVVDSTEVGVEKPDPAIFAIACDRLGLPPGRCAYLGDLITVDVEGAARAGLRPVLVDHYGSYRSDEVPEGVPRAVEASELVAGLGTPRSGNGGPRRRSGAHR